MTGGPQEKLSAELEAYRKSYPHGPLLRPAGTLRTIGFLLVNFIAYAFVNAFLHYISSGQWISSTAADYKQSMASPFGDMLLSPLNVFSYPWLILVSGLLLTAVITVPLLVACMYHSRASVLFLFCPAVLGHAPVLTLVLAVGCVLVAGTVLRRRNPVLALLLGLLPLFVYLYFSASPAGGGTPMRQLVLRLPFLIAAMAAILSCVIVLLIAHWSRYKPGVICPVLVILAITPIWLFHYGIGPAEMSFSLLANRLTASESLFASEPLGGYRRRHVDWTDELTAARQRLQNSCKLIDGECDEFLKLYPDSHRRAGVLWIRGLTSDTRLSLRALEEGYFSAYDSQPRPSSRPIWQQLLDEYPESPAGAVAAGRLAVLDAVAGDFDACAANIKIATAQLGDIHVQRVEKNDAGRWGGLFVDPPQHPSLEYLRRLYDQLQEMRWTMQQNDIATNAQSAEAFQRLLELDREMYNRSEYTDRLMYLAEVYVDTPMSDNILLADIMDISNLKIRAMQLREMENLSGADAGIKANFELGRLAMRTAAVPGLGQVLAEPQVYFKRVCEAGDNPWRLRSEQYLLKLQSRQVQQYKQEQLNAVDGNSANVIKGHAQ